MQTRLVILILVVLAFLAVALRWQGGQSSRSTESVAGQQLFPGLEQQLNHITRVRVEHRARRYDVVKHGDQWQLPDKGGYPVLFERVKPLLLGLAQLEKVEAQTDKPKNYARLGVQEPAAGTDNTRIEVYAGGEKPVASLIIGRIRKGLIAGGRDGISVRISARARTWLVAGHLALAEKPVDWVDRQFIHIKPRTVKRVTITQPDGSRLVVEKSRQGAPNYTVMKVPEGAVLKKNAAINALARGLAALKMDDVFVRRATRLPEPAAVTAVLETWDGLQIAAHTLEQDKKAIVWFDVNMATVDVTDLSRVRQTQDRLARLHARLDGWAFQIPLARAHRLRMRIEDLMVSPATE